MRIRRHHALYVLLLGPIFAGVLRKALPGQPVAVEALPLLTILFLLGLGAFRIEFRRCGAVASLAWVWAILCVLYSVPALFIDISLGLQAATLAAGAPLIGLIFLRDAQPGDVEFSLRAMRAFVIMMALQAPIGVYMLLFGNAALPDILRANMNQIAIGKEYRIGQNMLAGYFTTAPVNSVATLCAFGMACSLFLRERSYRRVLFWGAMSVALLAVVWMTARRGAFFCCVLVTMLVLLQEARHRGVGGLLLVSVIGFVSGLAALLVFPSFQELLLGDRLILLSAGGLSVSGRFEGVFLRFLTFWIEDSPFGNYTGYASGVGKAFEVRDTETMPAEVGAAMLVAEQGVLGLMLFTLLFVVTSGFMVRRMIRSGQYWCLPIIGTYVSLFVLFYFKENSALFPGFIGSLVFWALPGLVAMHTPSAVRRSKPLPYAPAVPTHD